MPSTAIDEDRRSRLSQIMSALRLPLRLALDVALPPLCPSCRDPVGDGGGLCATCWSKLSPIERPFCEKLGIPFAYDPGPGIYSMQAIAAPPAYARARLPSAMTTSPAPSSTHSNMATGSISHPSWRAGWAAPAKSC